MIDAPRIRDFVVRPWTTTTAVAALTDIDTGIAVPPAPVLRTVAEVERLAERVPRPLVLMTGAFEARDAGPASNLRQARRFGAALVVGVHAAAAPRWPGPGGVAGHVPPGIAERCRAVAALPGVDAVVVMGDDGPHGLICLLRPQVYVGEAVHRDACWREAVLMRQWAGRVQVLPPPPHRGAWERRLPQAGDPAPRSCP